MRSVQVFILTLLALIAFAGNSVLCRLALLETELDPATFTAVRLMSGAFTLALIITFATAQHSRAALTEGSWISAMALFGYAAGFTFAYVTLDTATGALVLFACVQFTMIFYSIYSGHRLIASEWLGLVVSLAGLTYLLYPSNASPSPFGVAMMAFSGIAWGVYTIRGKKSANALLNTSGNFFRTLPMLIILLPFIASWSDAPSLGITYAILSGAITSGMGYAIWYLVLPHLSTSVAAVSQLSVPAIAALGGVLVVGESLSLQLGIASVAILSGILLVIFKPHFR